MDGLLGGLVEGGEGFHEVHVDVECFAVAAGGAGAGEGPVAVEHFEVTAIKGVGAVFCEKVEAAAGVVESDGVSGGEGVFGEGVDGEAVSVDDLLVAGDVALAIGEPEETALAVVPHFFEEEFDAVAGELGAEAFAIAGAVCGSHGVDGACLGDEGFFVVAGVAAVAVEMGDEAAMAIITAAGEPEGQ